MPYSKHQSNSMKWAKSVRALPLESSNDVLKTEYIEVNLNNSRKLIRHVNGAGSESSQKAGAEEKAVESVLLAKGVRSELGWADQFVSSSSEITKSSNGTSPVR